jgi:hypothetical protein
MVSDNRGLEHKDLKLEWDTGNFTPKQFLTLVLLIVDQIGGPGTLFLLAFSRD